MLYSDARGRCEVLKAIRGLAEPVRDRVANKILQLEVNEWRDLFKNQVVKELAPGIYELRPKGVRLTFFLATCRGENEVVITDCEKRGDLAGVLWKTFIHRAGRLREEWIRRNCTNEQEE